ncbi:MAG: peptidoglycan/xylan/chitin deacetylase (PgdA/CDA1 family) [Acidimicrobiales bacterium]|jgi:peptidoglycan-N-acetylglucosamine deacetylase
MSFTVNDRGHVCLTFDFDGPSVWLMRRMGTPTPVSRGEFGAVAVPRILKMLEKRDIGSTWFIPGHTIETYPDVCKMVADHGCEVGLHGYTHELNPLLSEEEERALFVRTIELVEKLTGAAPTGYRSPAGEMTNQTIDLLVEYGMTYDSSLMGHDYQPYALRSGDEYPMDGPVKFGRDTPLVELPWSWTLDDYVYLEFVTFKRMLMPGLKRPEDMFANFTGDVEWMARDVQAGVVTPIFHPQVIGRGHRLLAMENWIDQIADLGITFSKMTDIAAAHHAGTSFGIE